MYSANQTGSLSSTRSQQQQQQQQRTIVSQSSSQSLSSSSSLDVRADAMISSKQLTDAALVIERELDGDERRSPQLDELNSADNGWYTLDKNRLQLRRSVPIPQPIIEQYDQLECKSFVGLLPAIHRAFITIDNKLFLWNYYDGSDFYLYDDLSQIIVSVALLKPKPGVFVDSIAYVLVVSTIVDILMFAIKFDDDNCHMPLQLFPTQFRVPADGVQMSSITGTDEGRVLLIGKNGVLYELDYWSDAHSGWIGGLAGSDSPIASGAAALVGALISPITSAFGSTQRKCRKLNHTTGSFSALTSILPRMLGGVDQVPAGTDADAHIEKIVYDSSRRMLYTLSNILNRKSSTAGSSKPCITAYDLGADGLQMTLRSRVDNVMQEVQSCLRGMSVDVCADLLPSVGINGSSPPLPLRLAHICVVPKYDSAFILLMAVTNHGHRLYFDLGGRNGSLRVKMVRLCTSAVAAEDIRQRGGGGVYGGANAINQQQMLRAQRLTPSYMKASSPSLVHVAYYRDGTLLMADAGRSAVGDSLIAIHNAKDPSASSSVSSSSHRSISGSSSSSLLIESVSSLEFESRIADVSEVPLATSLNLLSSSLFARTDSPVASLANGRSQSQQLQLQPLQGLPEVATQHVTPNRQFLVLTSRSLLTLSQQRPIDEMKRGLYIQKQTGDASAIDMIARKYGAKDACAMCLLLIGSTFASGSALHAGGADVDEFDRRGIELHGTLLSSAPSTVTTVGGAAASVGGLSDDQLRKMAKQAFFRFGEQSQQMHDTMSAYNNGYNGINNSVMSVKVEGIALYMSRWLRSHWDFSLCVASAAASAPLSLTSMTSSALTMIGATAPVPVQLSFRFSQEYYVELLAPLVKLKKFIRENRRIIVAGSGGVQHNVSTMHAQSGLADTGRLEQDSMDALAAALNLTIEIFNLLVLFMTHSSTMSSSSPSSSSPSSPSASSSSSSSLLHSSPFFTPADRLSLRDLKFCDVLTSVDGHQLVQKLINTLANVSATVARGAVARSNNDDIIVNNPIIDALHSSCPTFFGSSELLYYTALESIQYAKQYWHQTADRQAYLDRALRTYSQFVRSQQFPIEDIAAKLKAVHEYEGIVELAMARAELFDKRDIARPSANGASLVQSSIQHIVPVLASTQHLTDAEYYGHQKQRCINVILDTLNVLILGRTDSATTSTSSSSSSSSSVPPMQADDIATMRDRVIVAILSSHDYSLHSSLYTWLITHNRLTELYAIQTAELTRYLTEPDEYIVHRSTVATIATGSVADVKLRRELILKDYYLRNEKWNEAALLLNYMSMKTGSEYNLHTRVEFITKSLECARKYQLQLQQFGPSSSSGANAQRGAVGRGSKNKVNSVTMIEQQDLIDQLKDRIDIAKIQGDIYAKLKLTVEESYSDAQLAALESASIPLLTSASSSSSSAPAPLPAVSTFLSKKASFMTALADLDSSLLDIQDLYTFCTKFSLWECCLAIIRFSNEHQRGDVIAALWKNILRSEIQSCKSSGRDWGRAVADKFISLAADEPTRYRDVEFMFPLDFLIRELERNNFLYRTKPDGEYVSETLMAAGIHTHRLLQQYDAIVDNWDADQVQGDDSKERRTNGNGEYIHIYLYKSIYNILKKVVDDETSSRRPISSSSSPLSASALSVFNKCLTSIRTIDSSSDTEQLINQFQQLYQTFTRQRR